MQDTSTQQAPHPRLAEFALALGGFSIGNSWMSPTRG